MTHGQILPPIARRLRRMRVRQCGSGISPSDWNRERAYDCSYADAYAGYYAHDYEDAYACGSPLNEVFFDGYWRHHEYL